MPYHHGITPGLHAHVVLVVDDDLFGNPQPVMVWAFVSQRCTSVEMLRFPRQFITL